MRLSYKVCSMQDKAEEEKAEREKGNPSAANLDAFIISFVK